MKDTMIRMPVPRLVKRRAIQGQSMIEYIVVLAVGVLVLVGGEDPPIQQLARAIHEYYTDYSYGMSIAHMPNCYWEKSAGPVTANVDKCINLKNPEWPVDVSFD